MSRRGLQFAISPTNNRLANLGAQYSRREVRHRLSAFVKNRNAPKWGRVEFETQMVKNTICLWYDHDAEGAAQFYVATFPESRLDSVQRAPADYPSGKAGDVLTVHFTVAGVACMGLIEVT